MKKLLLASLVTVAALSSPRTFADEPPDTLLLQDGTILRGHVTELVPQTRATIVLLTGEPRVIEWSRVARATGPTFTTDAPSVIPPDSYVPPAYATTQTATSPAPPGSPASDASHIKVIVESTVPARTVALDQHLTLAPAASDRPFRYALPPPPPVIPPVTFAPMDFTLVQKMRSATGAFIAGGTMTGLGAVFVTVGALQREPGMGAFRATYIATGSLALVGGTIGLIVGIVRAARANKPVNASTIQPLIRF